MTAGPDSRRQCHQSEADWYVEVTFVRGYETNYAYGYYKGADLTPNDLVPAANDLVPVGWEVIQTEIRSTRKLSEDEADPS